MFKLPYLYLLAISSFSVSCISTPEVSTPEVSTPEVSTPEVSTPKGKFPGFTPFVRTDFRSDIPDEVAKGYISGDFDNNGTEDYAMLLKGLNRIINAENYLPKSDSTYMVKFVICNTFIDKSDHCHFKSRSYKGHFPVTYFLEKLDNNICKNEDITISRKELKDVVGYSLHERSTVAYYFDKLKNTYQACTHGD